MVTNLVQRVCFGDSKAPPLFKRSPDHGTAGTRCGRGQTKWFLKLETTHLNTEVNQVHRGVEGRETWLMRNKQSMKILATWREKQLI